MSRPGRHIPWFEGIILAALVPFFFMALIFDAALTVYGFYSREKD